MNEPQRLREAGGAAARLLAGSELEVPSASRKRALAFTGAAAGMLASSGAMAASGGALAKSVMLWVVVGTLGGGLMSLTVAKTISHFEARETPSDAQRTGAPPLPLPPPRSQPARAAAAPAAAPVLDSPKPQLAPATPTPTVASPAARAASPTKPSVSTNTSVSKPARVGSLIDEQRIIESVRAALAHGSAGSALATLDDHARSYPQGQFGPEALALRVEALSAQGNLEGARASARQFQRRYPHHPLLSRVEASVQR